MPRFCGLSSHFQTAILYYVNGFSTQTTTMAPSLGTTMLELSVQLVSLETTFDLLRWLQRMLVTSPESHAPLLDGDVTVSYPWLSLVANFSHMSQLTYWRILITRYHKTTFLLFPFSGF